MLPTLLQFCPLGLEHAVAILSWQYPAPYQVYNLATGNPPANLAHLLRPELHYVAVLDHQGELIAYRCFGSDARVPGGNYSEDALDLGGGLRPDLTGRGLGRHVIAAAMSYATREFSPRGYRTTVASFNVRAKKTYDRLGFRIASSFDRATDQMSFDVLIRDAAMPRLAIPMTASSSRSSGSTASSSHGTSHDC
jgi:[ribosomal protein S18]-alanine N-acetyltransferase